MYSKKPTKTLILYPYKPYHVCKRSFTPYLCRSNLGKNHQNSKKTKGSKTKTLKTRSRRGSSLVFLGFSIVLFVISYGIGFLLVAAILGAFFSNPTFTQPITDPGWQAIYNTTQGQIKFLVPLVPTIGIFIFCIKVLMVASVRGRD